MRNESVMKLWVSLEGRKISWMLQRSVGCAMCGCDRMVELAQGCP